MRGKRAGGGVVMGSEGGVGEGAERLWRRGEGVMVKRVSVLEGEGRQSFPDPRKLTFLHFFSISLTLPVTHGLQVHLGR